MLKNILRDSLPTMIAVMLSSMYAVIDGLFIGTATGDVGLAAINIAWPITALISAFGIGIGTGGSVLFSYAKGKGDNKQAKDTFGTTCTMLLVFGILLLIDYNVIKNF